MGKGRAQVDGLETEVSPVARAVHEILCPAIRSSISTRDTTQTLFRPPTGKWDAVGVFLARHLLTGDTEELSPGDHAIGFLPDDWHLNESTRCGVLASHERLAVVPPASCGGRSHPAR